VDQPRSPYWPDPLGKLQCIGPGCLTPQAPHEQEHHPGQLVIWGSAEYLLWWVKNQPLATPLVTTVPGVTTAAPPGTTNVGALGNPGTVVLFGGSDIDYHTFSGGRFSLGLGWGSSDDGVWGVEGSGFFTERRTSNFQAGSSVTGVPVLARPFFDALNLRESALVVSDPGIAAGNVRVGSDSALYGWDVSLVGSGYRDGPLHVDLLGGFRYLNLSEDIDISQNTTGLLGVMAVGNVLVPPTNVFILDNFGTRNEFYGGQLGGRVEYAGDRFFLSGLFKIGLGSMHEVVDLAGFTRGPANSAAGLLVLTSNSGRRAHDEFAAVPELGINVGYQVCHGFRVIVGYTFLYISDVVRPGDQINRNVNPNLIPASPTFRTATGPAEPAFSFQRTDFWAQGMNLGFEFRF
jgi:hypothetical protein